MHEFNAVWLFVESSSSNWVWISPLISSLIIGGVTIFVLYRTLGEMKRARLLSYEPRLLIQEGIFSLTIDTSSNRQPFSLKYLVKPKLVNAGSGAALKLKAFMKTNPQLLSQALDYANKVQERYKFTRPSNDAFVKIDYSASEQYSFVTLLESEYLFKKAYFASENHSSSNTEIPLDEHNKILALLRIADLKREQESPSKLVIEYCMSDDTIKESHFKPELKFIRAQHNKDGTRSEVYFELHFLELVDR